MSSLNPGVTHELPLNPTKVYYVPFLVLSPLLPPFLLFLVSNLDGRSYGRLFVIMGANGSKVTAQDK